MKMKLKDGAAGLLFIAIGVGGFFYAATSLKAGSSLNMGPGYFPMVLSGLLVFIGALILFQARSLPENLWPSISWRGVFAILGAPLLFGLLIDAFGLVPALGGSILLASVASRRMTARLAIPLTAGLVVACVAIFVWALGAPLRLFSPWFTLLAGQ